MFLCFSCQLLYFVEQKYAYYYYVIGPLHKKSVILPLNGQLHKKSALAEYMLII